MVHVSRLFLPCCLLALSNPVARCQEVSSLDKNNGSVPRPAHEVGFQTLTYSVDYMSSRVFDQFKAREPGYKLYQYNFFTRNIKYSNVLNPDGSLSVSGNNASVASAACADESCSHLVGTAFGGGAYVEVEISYDASKIDLATGWPAVWMLTMESITRSKNFHWEGQPPGYNHSVEVDLLEHHLGPNVNGYGVAVHDWFGYYRKSCPQTPYCRVTSGGRVALDPNMSTADFHRVGMLWVPATKAKAGSIRFFYDGRQVGPLTTWQLYEPTRNKPPVDAAAPWAWGVIDRSHMVLILGAGSSTPMRVRSINVWQASRERNIVR